MTNAYAVQVEVPVYLKLFKLAKCQRNKITRNYKYHSFEQYPSPIVIIRLPMNPLMSFTF